LRCRSTGKPLVDVVDVAPNRKGRPAITRGEKKWSFIRIEPPQGYTTLAERYLLPGTALWGTGTSRVVKAVVCEAGIVPGSPVRMLDDYAPSEIAHVIAANEPGPILGILLRPEGASKRWETKAKQSDQDEGLVVDVMVQGCLLLPAKGPIGVAPSWEKLLWDPENRCWLGQSPEGSSHLNLLELVGSWGFDHSSESEEPAAVFIDGSKGLNLELLSPS
jgi:hypothetical protein